MRFITSWPLATLLIGIAALMGLNATTLSSNDGEPEAVESPQQQARATSGSASDAQESTQTWDWQGFAAGWESLEAAAYRAENCCATETCAHSANPYNSNVNGDGANRSGPGNPSTAAQVAAATQCQELTTAAPYPAQAAYGVSSGPYGHAHTPSGPYLSPQYRLSPHDGAVFAAAISNGYCGTPNDHQCGAPGHCGHAEHHDNFFGVFGPQASLVRHLVELHEQVGELRGEASMREAMITMAVENAAMSAQLGAIEGHHDLMEQLVGQTIELTRMQALQEATSGDPVVATKKRPLREVETIAHVAVAEPQGETIATDSVAQQARIDELRRENDVLRAQIEAIRAQLAAITEPAKEPVTAAEDATERR